MKTRTFVDLFSALSGLALIINDVLIANTSNPTLLVIGAAMMGLPAIFSPAGLEPGEVERVEPKPKITRDTDLRIAQRPPEYTDAVERQVRKDMKRLNLTK